MKAITVLNWICSKQHSGWRRVRWVSKRLSTHILHAGDEKKNVTRWNDALGSHCSRVCAPWFVFWLLPRASLPARFGKSVSRSGHWQTSAAASTGTCCTDNQCQLTLATKKKRKRDTSPSWKPRQKRELSVRSSPNHRQPPDSPKDSLLPRWFCSTCNGLRLMQRLFDKDTLNFNPHLVFHTEWKTHTPYCMWVARCLIICVIHEPQMSGFTPNITKLASQWSYSCREISDLNTMNKDRRKSQTSLVWNPIWLNISAPPFSGSSRKSNPIRPCDLENSGRVFSYSAQL